MTLTETYNDVKVKILLAHIGCHGCDYGAMFIAKQFGIDLEQFKIDHSDEITFALLKKQC